jgi:hypothetical protein
VAVLLLAGILLVCGLAGFLPDQLYKLSLDVPAWGDFVPGPEGTEAAGRDAPASELSRLLLRHHQDPIPSVGRDLLAVARQLDDRGRARAADRLLDKVMDGYPGTEPAWRALLMKKRLVLDREALQKTGASLARLIDGPLLRRFEARSAAQELAEYVASIRIRNRPRPDVEKALWGDLPSPWGEVWCALPDGGRVEAKKESGEGTSLFAYGGPEDGARKVRIFGPVPGLEPTALESVDLDPACPGPEVFFAAAGGNDASGSMAGKIWVLGRQTRGSGCGPGRETNEPVRDPLHEARGSGWTVLHEEGIDALVACAAAVPDEKPFLLVGLQFPLHAAGGTMSVSRAGRPASVLGGNAFPDGVKDRGASGIYKWVRRASDARFHGPERSGYFIETPVKVLDPGPEGNGVILLDACRGDFDGTGDTEAAFLVLFPGWNDRAPDRRILLIPRTGEGRWFRCENVLGLEAVRRDSGPGEELLLDTGKSLLLGVVL